MKKMRNLLLLVLLSLCLALQVNAMEVAESGKCGDNATYTLYLDGRLVIEGTGEIYQNAFASREDVTGIEIRDGITEIGSYAFYRTGAVDVVMADSVISMGSENSGYAFAHCYQLENIQLSNKLTTIPAYTFTACLKLKELVIPDSVTAIGDYAFGECENLRKLTLGKGITAIDDTMFYTNNNLSEVILSEGLQTIGEYTFSGSKLKSIKIPNSVTAIGKAAFSFCYELESLELGKNLKDIPSEMCLGCSSLKEVKIPDGVKSIGTAAFQNCASLESIVIPDSVTSLNGNMAWSDEESDRSSLGAFSNCTNLKSITLGKGCQWIPWGFLSSDALETLIIPEGVKIIDNYAFCACPSLTYVQIPASVEYIGGFAFVDNFSMTNIVFTGDPPDVMDGMMGICGDYITTTFYPKNVPAWEEADTGTAAMIPYTLDSAGNIVPESPTQSEVLAKMELFRSGEYFAMARDLSAGRPYPNNYRYFINGNFLEGKGSEAFAFELSDACFGFLPLSDHRKVVYADLQVGDLLYMGDQVWVIGAIQADGVKVHGAEKEVIVYDRSLTKAQVEQADSYRTRYSVAPAPGVVNPNIHLKAASVPEGVPTEAQAYERIMALKETYPEGMSWTQKNMYSCNVQALIEPGVGTNPAGEGCSAFGYLASDTAFGTLPARYILNDKLDYDSIMVGDNLIGWNHQVVVLEVYENCLIIAEGNYNKMMHWGRIMTREEVEDGYDLFTRYPEGTVAPQRGYYEIPDNTPELPMENPFTDIGEEKEQKPYYYEPVLWAVEQGITTGKTETSFVPNDDCTRNQIVTFLWRASGEPEPASSANPFPDVPEGKYYTKAVLWAVEQGITAGYKDGTFGPGKSCTRSQVVTFLWRAAGEPEPVSTVNPFTDVPEGMFYTKAVLWAVEQGITTGKTATTFQPDATCTRAQIVTFLFRAMA